MFYLQLLKKEADENNKPVEQACSQLVDCLVENVLKLEEGGGTGNTEIVNAIQ